MAALSDKPALRLSEGSLYERLRRDPAVKFDPHVAHGALIYDDAARLVLAGIHSEYLEIGRRYDLPMQAVAGTWRASSPRAKAAGHDVGKLNRDNVVFMRELIESHQPQDIRLCGAIGPAGDAYRPQEALERDAALAFHRPQADALANAGVDELAAMTFPALSEAVGVAAAMAATGLPYTVSFVIRAEGTLLDGTPIADAIGEIDAVTGPAPGSFQVNCVHPTVFQRAMEITRKTSPLASQRVTGFQGNTSARTPEELDGLDVLETEAPEQFADAIAAVRDEFDIRIIGGCCGTTTAHMEAIAKRMANARH